MLRALNQFTKRLPSLIKMMVTVFLAIMATGGFLGALLEKRGVRGCPPNPEPLTWHYWLVLAAGLWFFWCVVRDILWPRLFIEEWTPVHAEGGLVLVQNRARQKYAFLTTHPSYVLIDLLAVLLPAWLMVMAWNEPCHASRQVLILRSAVALWCLIPVLRLVSWYILGRGQDRLRALLPENAAEQRQAALAWRFCWQPVLNLWALYLIIAGIIVGVIRWEQHKEERDTPRLDAAMREAALSDPSAFKEKRIRVTGTLAGQLQETKGNLRGLAARVETSGGPVLVFSDAFMASEFESLFTAGASGDVSLVATVMPEISENDRANFAWSLKSFGPPAGEKWLLLKFVKP